MTEPTASVAPARRAAELALLEASVEDLYEHAPCGYLSTLPDGTVIRANATFLEMTGYQAEDVVARRRFQDLLTAGGRIYHETHYAPLLRMQDSVREIAVDIVCADGRRLPVLVNSVLKRDESGEPLLVRTTVFDATDRREYERELLRARTRAEESEAKARVLAQTLQASLIPPAPPEIPGIDVGAVYRPAGRGDEVGGDFYDVFQLVGGEWAVTLGDVQGKGPGAATITALARYTVRAAAIQSPQPSSVMGLLNAALLRQGADRFCTMVYGRVAARAGGPVRVRLACGGHALPLLVGRDGGVRPAGAAGDLLGVIEGATWDDTTVELAPGEALVLFTDGISEGRRDGQFYGDGRVRSLLARHCADDAQTIARALVDDVVAFQRGLPRDDMAVVVLRAPAG